MSEGPMWKTRDGRKIPIAKMADSHLENAVRFCRRVGERYQRDIFNSPPHFEGEMAQYYAEQEWLEMSTMDIDAVTGHLISLYPALLEEYKRRKAAGTYAQDPT